MSRSGRKLLQGKGVDRFGAVASSLCAMHCAVCALLPATFGALGVGFLLGHEAEWIFTLVAVAFAAGALVLGWRRHRSQAVALLFVVGIVGLFASRGIEAASAHPHDAHHQTHEAQEAAQPHHDKPTKHEDHDAEPHHADSEEHADDDGDAAHLAGTAVGVLAGLLLLSGHLLNLRALRRRRGSKEECP